MAAPATTARKAAKAWCLYLIECRNGHYYAGITNDLDARMQAHREGRGARYTRANPPLLAGRARTDARRHCRR